MSGLIDSSTEIMDNVELKRQTNRRHRSSYTRQITQIFVLWKIFLLLVAYASPGPGYDTSTIILLDHSSSSPPTEPQWPLKRITQRLTRWDAIYFVNSAHRGHLFEQEWAFSWILSRAMAVISHGLSSTSSSPVEQHALAGILVAHVSHYVATLLLYALAFKLMPTTLETRDRVARSAAILFVLSPAGIFMSAPYGESTFAMLTFGGFVAYTRAEQDRPSTARAGHIRQFAWTLLSGLCFALSSTIRGNGLLSGLIFASDTVASLRGILQSANKSASFYRLAMSILGGSLVAIGFVLPQAIAYFEFCQNGRPRPWCHSIPPSIYSFVQAHYWNVGFLRYWTLSNLPLFLLAAPVCWLLLATSIPILLHGGFFALVGARSPESERRNIDNKKQEEHTNTNFAIVLQMALIQLVLTILAITSFHCQIINRISSGSPLWYIVIAMEIEKQTNPKSSICVAQHFPAIPHISPKWVAKGFVVYALIQGGLFTSFLPPA